MDWSGGCFEREFFMCDHCGVIGVWTKLERRATKRGVWMELERRATSFVE